MRHGSFIALLSDGTHRAVTGVFPSYREFKQYVAKTLYAVRLSIVDFVYAYGGEMQRYTTNEVLEVYFGE